jgi:hypothetical protein
MDTLIVSTEVTIAALKGIAASEGLPRESDFQLDENDNREK